MLRTNLTTVNPAFRRFVSARLFASTSRNGQKNTDLKKTVLYDFHLAHGGKMVEFAGWSLPVQYKDFGLVASHHHTRQKASLFDVSHMLQVKISGKDRIKFIESLVVGNIKELPDNGGTLSLFTDRNGGILDDVIINKTNEDHLYVVSNAGCSDKISQLYEVSLEDFNRNQGEARVDIVDNGLLALQGPCAAKALQSGVDFDVEKLYFMNGLYANLFGVENCRVTRCGYTGEDGFELSIPRQHAVALAERLLGDEDVELAGLGARDSLRLEAGLCLYGNDMDETKTPVEANLTWCIGKRRRTEASFPGASRVLKQIKEKPTVRRVGLVTDGPTARAGAPVLDEGGNKVGEVTSGCPSPTIQKNIAMAYVPHSKSKVGTKHFVEVRKKVHPAVVVKMPFTPSKYHFPGKS